MHNFTSWGTPEAGKSYQVPLLGQVLAFHIPSIKDKASDGAKDFPNHVMAPKPVVLRSINFYFISRIFSFNFNFIKFSVLKLIKQI